MRTSFFILLCLLCSKTIKAQNENNVWHFGKNAGVTFNSGSPVALTNGALNTTEGCATVCNSSGSLLFYTDGIKVWNKNHFVMPNGYGLNGHISTTQSAIIVPKPGDKNIYYIFTADANAGAKGLCYSVVDMNQNGGLGDIVQKNILLANSMTEKITSAISSDSCSVWVVAHVWNSDAFYSYKVTSTGVDTNKIISHCGSLHDGNTYSTIGCMKISPQSNKLALAITYVRKNIELFDFDNSTGVISNAIVFPSNYDQAYGIEFSPDGSKLYASVNNSGQYRIYQIDLSSASAPTILSSIQQVASSSDFVMSLQLGPDDKIYVSRSTIPYLGIIQSPNNSGNACNYIDNGVALSGRICYSGLPQKVITTTFPIANVSANTTILQGQSAVIMAAGGNNYLWSPAEGLSCATCAQPIASPTKTTIYSVVVSNGSCIDVDSVLVEVEIICDNLFIPNAFSPNEDGENDIYEIKGNCIDKFSLTIYDRWGNQLFESNDIKQGWDGYYKGNKMNPGVFCYRVITYSQGGKYIERTGSLSLVR